MQAKFTTNKGEFTIDLFEKEVPNTVANFTKLAKSGFYDGVKFHRVIEGFMIQAGDPNSKDDSKKSTWGYGGPGYTFADEIGPENRNLTGTISMANAGKNTNGSQFFINTNDNTGLDPKHTVFGRVADGMEVIGDIEVSMVDGNDCPIEPVIIEKIAIL